MFGTRLGGSERNLEDELCIVCGKATTFCCSKCRRIFYCSQTCQRTDWRSHKVTCSVPVHVPPTVSPVSGTLPLGSTSLAMYGRASEVLKECLMVRFGSMVGAYEWFDVNRGGLVSSVEFEQLVTEWDPSMDILFVKSLFSALDREGNGSFSLSVFLRHAVQRIQDPAFEPADKSVPVSDPSKLPAGRRALRTAAILAFRNGRYNDAIVSASQALGISTLKSLNSVSPNPDNLVELLLLAKAFTVHPTAHSYSTETLLNLIGEIAPPNRPQTGPNGVRLLCFLGEIFAHYKRLDVANAYYNMYLSTVKELFGDDSLMYSDAQTVLCGFELCKKPFPNFERAISLGKSALEIRSRHLVAPHARLADSLSNLATALKANRQYALAVPQFVAALEMRTVIFGSVSVPVADVQFSLGCCQYALGDIEASLSLLQAAQRSRLKLLGASNPATVLASEALNVVNPPPPAPVGKMLLPLPTEQPVFEVATPVCEVEEEPRAGSVVRSVLVPKSGPFDQLFISLKLGEKTIYSIFSILNVIFQKIQSGVLNLETFHEFINSKTENVSLVECLITSLAKEKASLLEDFLTSLAPLVDVDPLAANACIASEETELIELRKLGEPVVEEETRLRMFAEGIAVLCKIFDIPREDAKNQINNALSLLLEFYTLVEMHMHPERFENEGQPENESNSDESSSSESSSSASSDGTSSSSEEEEGASSSSEEMSEGGSKSSSGESKSDGH